MTRSAGAAAEAKDVTLLEVLDRILDKGVILAGDLTISVADVDLIFLGLKVMLASVERAERLQLGLDGGHQDSSWLTGADDCRPDGGRQDSVVAKVDQHD